MDAKLKADFYKYFDRIEDDRVPGMVYYPLDEMIFLILVGVLCCSENYEDVVLFGNANLDWLRQYFPYEKGIPHPKTLQRLLNRLDPQYLHHAFEGWMRSVLQNVEGVIAIDGKTARGSKKNKDGQDALHMLSAYACQEKLCIASQKVDHKTNEITAIPKLLDALSIKGCTITIDAMGTQVDIAKKIVDKKADYILALKGNQGRMYDNVRTFFKDDQIDAESFTHTDAGHGRIETRTIRCLTAIDYLKKETDWPKLQTIIEVSSCVVEKKTGKQSMEKLYYISSLKESCESLLNKIRSHWAIENSLHWILDVHFKEDQSRVRKDSAPQNLSLIRKTCLNLLRLQQDKLSIRMRMKKCLFDDQYRKLILKG